MKIEKLAEIIEKTSPLDLQEQWDNSGFQIKFDGAEIKKVLVAMEITDEVIDEAELLEVGAIVTHHPLIFGSIKAVNDESFIGRRLIKLIKNDISLYAMHTRQKSLFRYRQKALRSVIVLQIEFYHTTHQKVRVAV